MLSFKEIKKRVWERTGKAEKYEMLRKDAAEQIEILITENMDIMERKK